MVDLHIIFSFIFDTSSNYEHVCNYVPYITLHMFIFKVNKFGRFLLTEIHLGDHRGNVIQGDTPSTPP